MELQLKTKNDKQILACEAWADPEVEEILYGGAKGGAKSFTGAFLIFGSAHMYPETNWFIARKELIDLKKFTIPSIYEVHKVLGLDTEKYLKYDGQLNCFTLPNGSKVFLIACVELPSDPLFERFGSMQMTGGWLEEAGEIAEAARSNLKLAIGRWKNDVYNIIGKLFITANPKKGWLKREFVDPWKAGTLAKTKRFIQAFITDNPYLPASYVEKVANEKDPIRRQRLYLGEWDYDENKDSIIMDGCLSDAFSNSIIKSGERYLTVDVARLGRDSTVYSFWKGLELYKIERFQKQTIPQTIQTTKDFAASDSIPFSHILIDEDGVGGGVVDGLFGTKGFVAQSRPLPTKTKIIEKVRKLENEYVPETNFSNLKTQCAFKLAELINERKIAFRIENELERALIIEELTSLLRQRDIDVEGKIKLRSKDDVKVDIGRSPDIGDTIIFRAYFELINDASISNDPEHEKVMTIQKRTMAIKANKPSSTR